jgi:hypothetical protein
MLSISSRNPRYDFDRHPNIQYRDTTHFFWGTHPVKVTLRNPCMPRDPKIVGAVAAARRRSFLNRVVRHLTEGTYHFSNQFYGPPTYFFKDEGVASAFIDAVVGDVVAVHRPASAVLAKAMKGDGKVRIRHRLYFDRYRYRLQLRTRRRDKDERQSVDGWFEETMAHTGRVLLGQNIVRCIFCEDLKDVVLVKLALGREVESIEQVILRSEISANELPLGATPRGEGSDSRRD